MLLLILCAASQNVKRLLIFPRERNADHGTRSGNESQISSVRSKHLNARAGRDVSAPCRIDRAALAESTAFELAEVALVRQRTVGLNVKCNDHGGIRHLESLRVGAQDDAVGAETISIPGSLAARVRIVKRSHREIGPALAVRSQIVDHHADAVLARLET